MGLENGRFYQGIPKKVPKDFNPVEQEWYKLAIKSQGEGHLDRTLLRLYNPKNHYYCFQVCERP